MKLRDDWFTRKLEMCKTNEAIVLAHIDKIMQQELRYYPYSLAKVQMAINIYADKFQGMSEEMQQYVMDYYAQHVNGYSTANDYLLDS